MVSWCLHQFNQGLLDFKLNNSDVGKSSSFIIETTKSHWLPPDLLLTWTKIDLEVSYVGPILVEESSFVSDISGVDLEYHSSSPILDLSSSKI